ncbi:MAG TPA: DUF5996 family protein [Candidatus Dormibacteraeota bacterium]
MAEVTRDDWPDLPHAAWRDTLDTLHMYAQVLGKLRLALSPFEPVWQNVPLYVTPRGLTTSAVPFGLRTFDAELDLIDHSVVLRSSHGGVERRPIGGAVAEFHGDVMSALAHLGIDVEISTMPVEVPNPIPFPDDRTHSTYNPAHATLFHRVLAMVDVVTKEHRARFAGWSSRSQFFWGTFDLALARFSGRRFTPPEDAHTIRRYGATHEEICCGWWPGEEGMPVAAFYAYSYPMPMGLAEAAVAPGDAGWDAGTNEFLLRYDAVRGSADPRRAILDFCESTYAAAARLLGWDGDLIDVEVPPPSVSPRRREHRRRRP